MVAPAAPIVVPAATIVALVAQLLRWWHKETGCMIVWSEYRHEIIAEIHNHFRYKGDFASSAVLISDRMNKVESIVAINQIA